MIKAFEKVYSNHVLGNLLFILVLAMGLLSYQRMPREQDPSINFNWIQVTTLYPGASAVDVEKLITDKIEDAISHVSDIKFVSSNSREGLSSILVRFNDLPDDIFEKRVNDLRREIQNAEDELPDEVDNPDIVEITSANAFPTATLVVVGQANDELLRKRARDIMKDIERMDGVDRVQNFGLHDPEIQIQFDPSALNNYDISSSDIISSIQSYFNDITAGTLDVGSQRWLVRWMGQVDDPAYLSTIPILSSKEELALGEVADISRTREQATRLVSYKGQPAIMLAVMKKAQANTLKIVEKVKDYVVERHDQAKVTGVDLVLLDDQTAITRNALSVMETNAFFGLCLVLLSTWLFLGFGIAFLVSIGIPFALAGTFWTLNATGQTLNVSVLLGVVICLGMLVDDSVVVVEAVYYRLSRGVEKMRAIREALMEVFAPVTTSVLTTISAFVPLMLLPGILGKFMLIIPLVVTIGLLFSLIEAYWMLPAHISGSNINLKESAGKMQHLRVEWTRRLRLAYGKLLAKILRYPKTVLLGMIGLFILAVMVVSLGLIRFNFFASDPLRIFYVNIEMPSGSSLENTLEYTKQVERVVRQYLKEDETRSVASYSGLMFTETEPFIGDSYGQISVSLIPGRQDLRPVDDVIESMRDTVIKLPGPKKISFLRLAGGPPTAKPISIKVRGQDYDVIRAATNDLIAGMRKIEPIQDISDDDNPGRSELVIKPDFDAIQRANLNPTMVAQMFQLLGDGAVITNYQSGGEKVNIRLKAKSQAYLSVQDILQQSIVLPDHSQIRLASLVQSSTQPSFSNIRHYNLKRAITVEADLDKDKMDTVQANNAVVTYWQTIKDQYPSINLDFSGELDDIQESIDSMPILFLFGVMCMYILLGTQFKSYWQPLLILITVPLAFVGVVMGLLITQNPLSLYTLYGIVALSGITVNAAIVLISAANQRLAMGMDLVHATIYAARRRLIPILITSLTTIAGLFSLATGLGGKSLLWGPVATSIVWGLMVSTALTLFVVPILYSVTTKHMQESPTRLIKDFLLRFSQRLRTT